MVRSKWEAQTRWQPCPELLLNRLYHPALCEGHPVFEVIPPREQELVRALHNQHQRWSHKPYFRYGLSDRLIAALNGYRFAAKLADCMMVPNPCGVYPFAVCGLDWFCPYCAYLKGQDLLKKYADAWTTGKWYSMVLSLKLGICPADPEHDTIREVHDAMVAILKRLQGLELMAGYVAWLEIKIRQFYPFLIVTPHIHVLLQCDCAPDRPFYEVIAGEWMRNELKAAPNLFLRPVTSEAHFHELLQYIKPIDLYGPYERGYQAAKADGKVELFHREVQEFFHVLTVETTEYQGGKLWEAVRKALKRTLPKKRWKTVRKHWDQILADIAPKPTTEPLSKVLTEAITKTLKVRPNTKSKAYNSLTAKITSAALSIQPRREPRLVTRRRFLYGGDCHGSAECPLGLEKSVRRTQQHQEDIRAKVALAREVEGGYWQVEGKGPAG